MNPFFPGPPPGFAAPPPGLPFGFLPPAPPFGCPPQGPPPCMNAKTRYVYRTRDGGPPDMGKPPSAPGPPPPPFGFPGFPPGPPPPGPFCFGAPPAPPGAPPPWVFQPPPAPPSAPSHLCFQNANGTTCVPTSATTTTTTTTSAPFDPATYKGPLYRPGGTSTGTSSGGAAPGNRVNERLVKADDGSGVLLSPDQTCLHVLDPGQSFGPHTCMSSLVRDKSYKVQYADSDWPVDKVIELLGGKTFERLGQRFMGHTDTIGIQEWTPTANDHFKSGELIMLNDVKAKMTLRQHGWGPERGRAGQKPPVWIMLWPVKED